MKKSYFIFGSMILSALLFFVISSDLSAEGKKETPQPNVPVTPTTIFSLPVSRSNFWGMRGPGITDNIPSPGNARFLYLTLDACDGDYDKVLIDFLRARKIQATLFINTQWINHNPRTFAELAADPLFMIANHGTRHKPASVSGKYAYGIKGTASREELSAEININADRIERLTGLRPYWYRSGTAYYDGESIDIIIRFMRLNIAGFAVNLDGGARKSASEIYKSALTAKPGDILIAHMNRPKSQTAAGLMLALPELIRRGFVFSQLP